jgi:hypothetical protein
MSSDILVSNLITNETGYSLQPHGDGILSGSWALPPQPVAPWQDLLAFQIRTLPGTTVSQVAQVTYDVLSEGAQAGTLTLELSFPFEGSNGASWSTTVPGLQVAAGIPPDNGSVTFTWTCTAAAA